VVHGADIIGHFLDIGVFGFDSRRFEQKRSDKDA
jgi:hypothetical protein